MEIKDVTIGLRHREISHLIEILSEPQSKNAQKIKALRLLHEVLPGRQQEAIFHNIIGITKDFLLQKPNGILLNTLVLYNILVNDPNTAHQLSPFIPKLVDLISPEAEVPIKMESISLLRRISSFIGPVEEFITEGLPKTLISHVSSRFNDQVFLQEAFVLISRLISSPTYMGIIIQTSSFLMLLVRSFSNISLRSPTISLASSIAMEPSHKGKIALIQADVFSSISPFLDSRDSELKFSILSLIALLTVPREGKHKVSTDQEIPDLINRISQYDNNEKCRKVAESIRILVSEIPLGEAIMGHAQTNTQYDN